MTESLPEDIRRFLLAHIDSIAEMEALVMLSRAPHEAWSATQVAARLYVRADEGERILARLTSEGLAERRADGSFVHARLPEAQAQTVVHLVALYATHLIPITNLIHSKGGAGARIRQFADAFHLRKKE